MDFLSVSEQFQLPFSEQVSLAQNRLVTIPMQVLGTFGTNVTRIALGGNKFCENTEHCAGCENIHLER